MNKRGRGRPPKSDHEPTRERLLEAASDAFAERGFAGATVTGIAARVGVTPAAVYNHFGSKDELLYLAGRHALDQLVATMSATGRAPRELRDLAELYLQPGMARARLLLLELHMAAVRRPELAAHLAAWHEDVANQLAPLGSRPNAQQRARVKALFLLLLGLCHLEQLDAIDADPQRLTAEVTTMVASLFPL
jgi:AcrR family transcriptional regulator